MTKQIDYTSRFKRNFPMKDTKCFVWMRVIGRGYQPVKRYKDTVWFELGKDTHTKYRLPQGVRLFVVTRRTFIILGHNRGLVRRVVSDITALCPSSRYQLGGVSAYSDSFVFKRGKIPTY